MGNRVTISALQDNPSKYFHDCHEEPVEVLRHGQTIGYIVPPIAANTKNFYSASSAVLHSIEASTPAEPKGDHEKNHDHS